MPKYGITIPIAGFVWLEVEADDEDHAKELAFDHQFEPKDIQEWNLYESFDKGNVSMVETPTKVEIEVLED